MWPSYTIACNEEIISSTTWQSQIDGCGKDYTITTNEYSSLHSYCIMGASLRGMHFQGFINTAVGLNVTYELHLFTKIHLTEHL